MSDDEPVERHLERPFETLEASVEAWLAAAFMAEKAGAVAGLASPLVFRLEGGESVEACELGISGGDTARALGDAARRTYEAERRRLYRLLTDEYGVAPAALARIARIVRNEDRQPFCDDVGLNNGEIVR